MVRPLSRRLMDENVVGGVSGNVDGCVIPPVLTKVDGCNGHWQGIKRRSMDVLSKNIKVATDGKNIKKADVITVEEHSAGGGFLEAVKSVAKSGLTAAVRADDTNDGGLGDLQDDSLQDCLSGLR